MADGTYSDASSAERDLVRGQIGDVGPNPGFHLTDGEIDRILGRIGGSGQSRFYQACALACLAIAGKRVPASFSLESGGVSLDRDPVYQNWRKQYETFLELAEKEGAVTGAELITVKDPDLEDVFSMTGAHSWRRESRSE